MSDLINRQDAIDYLGNEGLITAMVIIDRVPTANVRENRTGEWQITDAYPHNVYCSVCHRKFAQTHWTVWEDGSLPRDFCPNCGADMRPNKKLQYADNDTAYGGLQSAT